MKLDKKDVSVVYDIVPLNYDEQHDIFFLIFTEKKFIYNEDRKEFFRLKPTLKGLHISDFQKGTATQDTTHFSLNNLDIPIRKFNDVFKDQIME